MKRSERKPTVLIGKCVGRLLRQREYEPRVWCSADNLSGHVSATRQTSGKASLQSVHGYF